MKPNFALSLSFDGIQLLHRATGGWRLVGEVALDAKDLKGALSKLKQKAEKLGAGPIRSKLIIPDDQIKYLKLDSGSGDADARRQQARSALDGATPYVLSDLEYDISVDGKTTHVAAVARETLEEAESFAVDHGFGPISFVAAPDTDANAYMGEPFFGTTRWVTNMLSKGDKVEQDGIAVVNIGPVEDDPDTKDKAPKTPEPAPPTPALKSAVDATPKADTSFASVRGARTIDELDKSPPKPRKVDDGMAASSIPIPKMTPAVEPSQTPPKPRFTISPGDDGPAATPPLANGAADVKTSTVPPKVAAAIADKKAAVTAPLVDAPAPKPTKPANAKASQIGAITPVKKPSQKKVDPEVERRNLTIFGARPSDEKAVGGKPKGLGLMLTAGLVVALAGVGAYAALFADDGVSGLWSDDEATIAAVEPLTDPDPQPTPVETQDPDPVVAAIEAPQPIELSTEDTTEALDLEPVVVPDPDGETVADPVADPESEPALETVDTAAIESAIEDAIGVEPLEALSLPETGPTEAEPEIAALTDQPETGAQTTVEAPTEPVVEAEPEAPVVTEDATPDDTVTETEVTVLDALRNATPDGPLTPENAQAAYSLSGIWQLPPDGGIEQTRVDIDDIYVASIDTNTITPDIFSLPPVDTLGTDAALEPIALPPPAGLSFKLDERGLVIASPEGTLSPEGIVIYSGPPAIVPPPTPERSAAAAPAPQADPSFAPQSPDVRPRSRPVDLIEQNERGQLGGFSRTELAGLRPRVRPLIDTSAAVQSVLEDVQAEEETVQAAEIDSATELAVVLSPAPSARPGNIATIVERAQVAKPEAAAAASTATVTQVAAVAPRTVTPNIPSSTSVAREATVKNVLNLRQVNLMGVAGKPSARRALVRMPNGRIATVKVGDRIDGGRVVAIGEAELRYKKGSRNLVLKMPRG